MELVYAHYLLTRITERPGRKLPHWYSFLEEAEPALILELRAASQAASPLGRHDLFLMASSLGYWKDDAPERFLNDLPTLPTRLLELLEDRPESDQVEDDALWDGLVGRMRGLDDHEGWRSSTHLFRLWDSLRPMWLERGLDTVVEHCRLFSEKLEETGDIVRALPPYHFTRLEMSASNIRAAAQRKRIIVMPLFFANAGGFSFDAAGELFVGFGLHSGHALREATERVDREAQRLKALSDPTRLLLLTLLTRYSSFAITVGDLANHLGVSQPTVSGHLKVLREAGMVHVERDGNRSYYRPDRDAIEELLTDLTQILVPR